MGLCNRAYGAMSAIVRKAGSTRALASATVAAQSRRSLTFALHPLPARHFSLGGMLQLERSDADGACALVNAHGDAGRRHAGGGELQRARFCARPEQALARAEDEGENQKPKLVDEIVGEEGLQQHAAALRQQVGPVLLLQPA